MKEKFMKLSFKKKAMLIVAFELLCLICISIPITMAFMKERKYGGILDFMSMPVSTSNDIEVSSDASVEEDSIDGNMLYSFDIKESVDRNVVFDDNDYHIVISSDGKSISVNNTEIYNTDEQVNSIYCLDDVIILNTSNLKDKLISINFNGEVKVLDEQNAIISIDSVDGKTIRYSVKGYDKASGAIYLPYYIYMYNIDYMGDMNFTKPRIAGRGTHYTDCIKEYNGYCLLNDDSNFKVELKDPVYEFDYIPESDLISYLKINDRELSFKGFYVDEIRMLYDGYLYVSLYDTGIGYDNKIYIIDSDGDIVNDVNNFITDLMIDSSKYDNGIISYYTDAIDSVENACSNLDYNKLKPDSIVFKSIDLKYIGKGKLSIVNRKELTFSQYLKELGYNSCDDLIY